MSTTATLIRGPWYVEAVGGFVERCLWETTDGKFILTSSVNQSWGFETKAFHADEHGNPAGMSEIGEAGFNDHVGALRAAGYAPDK